MKLGKLLTTIGLLAGAALATATLADELKLPEGKAALHYYRPGGDYGGWGLHVWESSQKKSEAGDEFAPKEFADRPLKGVNWFKPLPQSGKDDFGVYWLLDTKDFENGRVNYIIHRGDVKDQCNKDMFWVLKDSKEAWVNADDCKVYMTKEEALKARK